MIRVRVMVILRVRVVARVIVRFRDSVGVRCMVKSWERIIVRVRTGVVDGPE